MKNNIKSFIFINVLILCILSVAYLVLDNKIVETSGVDILYKTIIIDPGHGGFDPGKPGINGEDEKHLNLKIALKLRDKLESAGIKVVMTRTTDDDVDGMQGVRHKSKDMLERKKIAEGGNILVSIHQNSFPKENVRGAQVFYSQESVKGKILADCIQKNIKDNVDSANRRVAKSNTSYYVLKAVKIPSIIIECGFLTNTEEEKLLNTDEYQEKLAEGIYLGICEYLKKIMDETI